MSKTLFKASLKALSAFAALGVFAILGSFLLALFLRLVTLAWHWGWRLFALLAICHLPLAISARAQTTAVFFSMQNLTGGVNNRTINLLPDTANAPVFVGTNLLQLGPIQLQPVGGQVTTNLVPWGYSLYVQGWPRPVHIVVPSSTNTLNVVGMINTNLYWPLTIYQMTATGTNGINVTQTNNQVIIDGSGLDAAGTAWATFSFNATNGIYAFNLASSYGLPAAGVVGLGSAALVSTNTFYSQGVSGYLDILYNLAQGQVGWLVVSNLSSIQAVPPLLDYLWTAGNNTASLATFAAVSTNQITVYGAGTASANGTYTFNAAAGVWTNAATADTITNSGAYLIIATGATKLYKSSNALAYPAGSGAWFNGSGYSGSSPMPYNAFLRVTDYSLNNVAPTNIPGKALTGLATNTVVPISAHVTNGVVTWTSP